MGEEKKVNRTDFLNALELVMPGIEKKTTIMGMDFVVLEPNYIKSFNDNIGIVVPFKTGLNCAVHCEELFKFLGKALSETVFLEEDEALLKIRGGKVKSELLRNDPAFESIRNMILSLDMDGLEWKKLPGRFIQGLELCLFSVVSCSLTSQAQATLSGVVVKGDIMMACDNFRASKYKLDGELFEDLIVLPSVGSRELVGLDKNFSSVARKGNWLFLKGENDVVVIALKLSMSDYPYDRISSLFEEMKLVEGELYTFPKGLEFAISVAEICADRNDIVKTVTQISLEMIGGELVVTGKKNIGKTFAYVDWSKNAMPEGLEIVASPEFMKKILSYTRSFRVTHVEDVAAILFETDKLNYFLVAKVKEG